MKWNFTNTIPNISVNKPWRKFHRYKKNYPWKTNLPELEKFLICSAVQLALTSSSIWHQKSGVAPRKPEDRTCSGCMKPAGRIIMIIFQYYYIFKNKIFNYLEGTFPWKYNNSTSITFSVKFRLTYRFRTFVLKCCYKCTAWFSKFWSRFEHSNPPQLPSLGMCVEWPTQSKSLPIMNF